VDVVPGDPVSVEVEALAADVAFFDFGKDSVGLGHATEEAVAVFCLAFGEFVDDEVGVLFELLIACGGKHESAGGEVVAEGVAFDSFGFPAAIAGGFGLDAGVDIESVEEADGVE